MDARQILRQGTRSLERLTRFTASTAAGRVEALRNRATGPKPLNDETITRKVESELFRDPDVPKGHINVNTVDGVVELRGQVKRPEMIKAYEAKVRAIPEVRDVQNLLHLPKTPAQTSKPRRTAGSSRERTRFNREVKQAEGEPTPADLASQRSGRPPSPLG